MSEVQPPPLPLRLPAQHGREVLRSHAQRALMALAALVLVTVATALSAGWRSGTFIVVEVLAVAAMLLGDRWLTPRLERREQGNDGELKVAKVLETAKEDGWLALHDVPTGHGNIDHVVIGPGGILTVETKSRRGRLNVASLDETWLKQAYAQRKWIERVTDQPADALLVLSDAYLDRPVSRQRGVCVLPARMLRGHLARRTGKLTPEQVVSIHARLARAVAESG